MYFIIPTSICASTSEESGSDILCTSPTPSWKVLQVFMGYEPKEKGMKEQQLKKCCGLDETYVWWTKSCIIQGTPKYIRSIWDKTTVSITLGDTGFCPSITTTTDSLIKTQYSIAIQLFSSDVSHSTFVWSILELKYGPFTTLCQNLWRQKSWFAYCCGFLRHFDGFLRLFAGGNLHPILHKRKHSEDI